MTMKRWDGSGQQDIASAARWDGTNWVALTVAKRWDGTNWQDIPLPGGGSGPLSVTASPAGAFAMEQRDPPARPSETLITNAVVVTATGGTGAGPTYQWTRVSGSASITATSPTSAATTFSGTAFQGTTVEATFRCRVTRGVEVQDILVPVSIAYYVGPIP